MDVTLKPWKVDDDHKYVDMMSHVDFSYDDEELRITSIFEARDVLRRQFWQENNDWDLYRAILLDGEVVGHVHVARQSDLSKRDGHVGCMLVKDAVGRGVGTEAVRQIVEMAFTRRKYDRLTAVIYSPNKASARMVEKVGFSLEATLRCAVYKNGCYYDALIYGLLRETTGIPTNHRWEPSNHNLNISKFY